MPTTNNNSLTSQNYDVAIIGAGPSGLAAATKLKQLGITSVVVLEREPQAGGIPRHCGHPPFGLREFNRVMTGPTYAAALVKTAIKAGVEIALNTTVVETKPHGELSLSTPQGLQTITAKRVILSTGVRETPRAPRFVTGQRPLGISTTGALQSMVYLKNKIPFKRPVVIGTELVSFSTLMTCRKAGIKPVAMIESNNRITARSPLRLLPMLMGIPVKFQTQIIQIIGKDRVTGIQTIDHLGREQYIDCDGVLFTGQFTPESTLVRMGHLKLDQASGGPEVDQFGRCSDPAYFATGNVLRPVETAGWSWQEGITTALNVAKSLRDELPAPDNNCQVIIKNPKIKYALPQTLCVSALSPSTKHLQLRFNEPSTGVLEIKQSGKVLWSRSKTFLPERRILAPLSAILNTGGIDPLEIHFREAP